MAFTLKLPLKKDSCFVITSPFGFRTKPKIGWHSGIDMVNAEQSIYAAHKGIVVWSGWRGNYGKCIIIKHPGIGNVWTLYGHLRTIRVDSGQEVPEGLTIGIMGSTGYSTGAHLHFEVRFPFNGILACHNPENYLT